MQQKLLKLQAASLQDVRDCLEAACQSAFNEASVEVVACPDLSKAPFHLAAAGLCGNCTMLHAGGVPYLLPMPQRQRRYELAPLLAAAGCGDGCVLGAGASPSEIAGKNAEFVINYSKSNNNNRVAMVIDDSDRSGNLANCRLLRTDSAELALMADAFCCSGHGGQVVRVRANSWKSHAQDRGHFTRLLQLALAREFDQSELPVGIGGAFRISSSGAVRIHVMPDFSQQPLNCSADVNNWLHFFDAPAPLVFAGTLLSHDPRNWGLRLEHFHGWNPDTEAAGGHFHFDVHCDTVQYEAYFCIAAQMLRVDPPGGVKLIQ